MAGDRGLVQDVHKEHRARKAGAKAKKKEAHQKKKKGLSTERHNPRAFSVANIRRTQKNVQRNLDRAQRKEHVPLVDRTEELPPPALVVVMGPKGCGKSTLIRSLVKYYTGQNLSDVLGPVTVVCGKKKRVTFFECPADDLCAMLDLAKVADLVLLMVDGSFGFEMETFEFLNMLQTHGFPKVMGVVTHLDALRNNKTLNKTKKRLKQRFWTEIYDGAKMFYLSGTINHKYLKNEIRNITLYVSRLKFRPLTWRNTHPYVLVDRFEDVTPPEKLQAAPNCERELVLYGYVRGSHLKPGMKVHLIGAGDFDMASVDALADPCPFPEKERSTLKTKETLLYAPMANVGAVRYDADAMYIDLRRLHYTKADMLDPAARAAAAASGAAGAGEEGEDGYGDAGAPSRLVRELQDVAHGLDEKLEGAGVRLFEGGDLLTGEQTPKPALAEDGSDEDEEEESDGEDGEEEEGFGVGYDDEDGEEESAASDSEDGSDEESGSEDESGSGEEEEGARWKEGLARRAADAFLERSRGFHAQNLMALVYGDTAAGKDGAAASGGNPAGGSDESDASDDDEDFFRPRRATAAVDRWGYPLDALDSTRLALGPASASSGGDWGEEGAMPDWSLEGEDCPLEELKRARFVTGGWGKGAGGEGGGDGEDGEEVYGDFEDLETGEVFKGGAGSGGEEEDESEDEDAQDSELARLARKVALKERFDSDFDSGKIKGPGGASGGAGASDKKKKRAGGEEDEEALDEEEAAALALAQKLREDQKARNKAEFAGEGEGGRLRYEGFRQGLYVRVAIKGVSAEFSRNFRPSLPVVVGGLLPHEMSMGLLRCRVKRHRWHRKVLKANDPLIFSIGWRRFQSIPLYSTEDQNERQRYLKYTPEHMHCFATFYGPLCPPNTGLLAVQSLCNAAPGFRVSLTGVVLEMDASLAVQKKLKLVGTPAKVFKNTAFVQGMFNSDLEVAKFEGAKIRTVSGVRGQIKKAVGQGAAKGTFRATFEDKILMSDLVFCRTWVPVEPARYYNPVCSLLEAPAAAAGAGAKKKKEATKGADDGDDDEEEDEAGTEEGEGGATAAAAAAPWQGMRTTAEIRKARQIPIPVNKDSLYKPIERETRRFNKLVVPQSLQAALPFDTKPKVATKRKNVKQGYLRKRAVVLEPEERRRRFLLQALATIRNDKVKKAKERRSEKLAERDKKQAREQAKFALSTKLEKKRKYREMGKADAARKRSRGSA